MPDDTTAGQGTLLWNLQTQGPEWVPLSEVSGRLAGGGYRAYSGTQATVQHGVGGEEEVAPEEASRLVEGGATATDTSVSRGRALAHEDALARHSGAGDKALAFISSGIEDITGGGLKGIPGEDPYERALRRDANPGTVTLSHVAALAGAVLAPESLIKYTPLGLAGEAGAGVASALRGTGGVIRAGAAEAAGGIAAGAILGTANQIGNAIVGRPVSGDAIVDDMTLGALIAGPLGAGGALIGKAAAKVRSARAEIKAAAGFEESAKPVAGAITDASDAWHTAHEGAQVRLKALNEIAEKAGVPEEWLAARNEAGSAADKAAKQLHKLAGTEDSAGVGRRIADLAANGKVKEAEKLFHAFNEYGTAVSRLDDAMRPLTSDLAYTDALGDFEGTMQAADHPGQQLEAMIQNGASAEEVRAFQARANEALGFDELSAATPKMSEGRAARAEQATGAAKVRKAPAEAAPVERGPFDVSDVGHEPTGTPNGRNPFAPDEMGMFDLTDTMAKPKAFEGTRPTVQNRVRPAEPARQFGSPAGAEAADARFTRPGEFPLENPSKPGAQEAGRRADQILYNAGRDARPVAPSELGDHIQQALDSLQAATGGRLGSGEVRELAKRLGMNTEKLSGPVASRLADLWGLHRMAEAVAEKSGAKATLLSQIVKGTAMGAGYKMGGYTGGRMMGAMADAAISGTRTLATVAGRMKQEAILGMAKVLSPVGRKAMTLGAIGRAVSTSYAPEAPPTTDYETKARQLRTMSKDAMETRLKVALKEVNAIDPMAALAAKESALRRMNFLASALPKGTYWGPFEPPGQPSQYELDAWHDYEAITHARGLVFDYLKSGHVPEIVKQAMEEQHPEFLSQLQTFVATHQDEVTKAPDRVKKALSQLLGMPISYESDPGYVARLQISYQEAKQKAAQAQAGAQQNQAIKAGIAPGSAQPTPGQLLSALAPQR